MEAEKAASTTYITPNAYIYYSFLSSYFAINVHLEIIYDLVNYMIYLLSLRNVCERRTE